MSVCLSPSDQIQLFLIKSCILWFSSLVKYVTEQIVQTVAVIVKCCTVDQTFTAVRQAFIHSTDTLLKSQDQKQVYTHFVTWSYKEGAILLTDCY